MFAPGHKAGQGDDLWLNGMPASQWYGQNSTEKPKNYYSTALVNGQPQTTPHAVGPAVAPPAWTPEAQAQDDEQSAQWNTYMNSAQGGQSAVTPPMPRAAASAAPADPQARNPIYSNMATQLSPTTMTALSGYQAQAPQRRMPYGASGLPFGRNLYGRGY